MSISRKAKRILTLTVACVLLAIAVWLYLAAEVREADPIDRLAFIKDQVRSRFPDAPRISTGELADRLRSDDPPVLLDVRRPEEYAVSHLPGAVRVDPDAPPQLPEGVEQDADVVAYCAVGWRSAKWVEELRRQGVDAVNLEGSIFQWVAEDRPLVRDGRPVDVVHPYSKTWAWLVDPEDRAFSP